MVKIPMDDDEIGYWLDEQGRDKNKGWLSSIDEDDLSEPARRIAEEIYLQGVDDVRWFEEPNIHVRERNLIEPAAKVIEQPDLLCKAHSAYYVIELKKKVGKKAVGQALAYYWALQHGEKLTHNGTSYDLIDNPTIVSVVAGIRWHQPYYSEFFNWVWRA
jgi:hypothetical protein